MKDQLQQLAEEFDLELDHEPEDFTESRDVDGVEMKAREATVIKPFNPDNGFLRNETHNFVLEGGDQLSVTVKHRPECPSCGHVLAEEDEPNTLAGECSVCDRLTCHRNQSKCEGCEKIFCPDHACGHGLKDNSYCEDCLGDVEEDLSFERGMEERKQGHSEEMEKLDKQLKEEKQRKELELKEIRQEREQIRKDWNTVIQLLNTVKEPGQDDDEDKDSDSGSLTGGTGGSLTGGGKPLHVDDSDEQEEDDVEPDWLDSQFHGTEDT